MSTLESAYRVAVLLWLVTLTIGVIAALVRAAK